MPSPIDPVRARSKLAEIRQRRKALSASAQERFAAREMGVDVPIFRAALKGEVATPKVSSVTPVAKKAVPKKWNAKRTAKWVTKDLDKQMSDLDADDLETLTNYVQNGSFFGINAGLRGLKGKALQDAARGFEEYLGGEGIDMGNVLQEARDLDKAIRKGKTLGDMTLYRGVETDAFEALKRGSVITDKGYMSSTLNPDVADAFGKTIMRITYPAGRSALHIDALGDLSLGQEEVLLPRGLRLRVTSINKVDGRTVINVTVD